MLLPGLLPQVLLLLAPPAGLPPELLQLLLQLPRALVRPPCSLLGPAAALLLVAEGRLKSPQLVLCPLERGLWHITSICRPKCRSTCMGLDHRLYCGKQCCSVQLPPRRLRSKANCMHRGLANAPQRERSRSARRRLSSEEAASGAHRLRQLRLQRGGCKQRRWLHHARLAKPSGALRGHKGRGTEEGDRGRNAAVRLRTKQGSRSSELRRTGG
mmetsp:Transcript_99924/g.278263  ORF Transcript_99924/g.278263 Transcript_99924/m.278263 type:complete len:214 (-) Transcript_99924:1412-2053(-)